MLSMISALYLALEERDRIVAAHHRAHHRQAFADDLHHLGLDLGQIVGRERRFAREVVIEAVLDDRTDRHLGVREESLRRLREQMRGRMAQNFQRIRMFLGNDLERGVGGDRETQVDEFAVDLAGQRSLGQAGADRCGDLADRGVRGVFAFRAIRQRDGDHVRVPCGNKKGRRKRPLYVGAILRIR